MFLNVSLGPIRAVSLVRRMGHLMTVLTGSQAMFSPVSRTPPFFGAILRTFRTSPLAFYSQSTMLLQSLISQLKIQPSSYYSKSMSPVILTVFIDSDWLGTLRSTHSVDGHHSTAAESNQPVPVIQGRSEDHITDI